MAQSSVNKQQHNPTQHLTTRRGMAALSESGRAVPPMMHEIATKVNNAKDKPRKLKVLQEHDSVALRQVLKGAFDPKIEWLLPPGDVPYTANDAPVGTEHTLLHKKQSVCICLQKVAMVHYQAQKEKLSLYKCLKAFVPKKQQFLVAVVNKRVNNEYKGFTANLVKDAFNWDDDFMQKEIRPSFQV